MAGISIGDAFRGFIDPGMTLCHLSELCNEISLLSKQRDI